MNFAVQYIKIEESLTYCFDVSASAVVPSVVVGAWVVRILSDYFPLLGSHGAVMYSFIYNSA